ncbi:MAG: SIMPL domain-containing protein [Bacteriovoracaceae bacterium]
MGKICVAMWILLSGALALGAQVAKEGVSVTGECKRKVAPDRVAVNFTLEELRDSVEESTERANKRYNQLLKELKKMKLKDSEFSTSEYSTFPHRVYENKKRILKGYKTRIGLKAQTSEMEKAGEILQAGGNLGQEFIQGPNPFVSDAEHKKYYHECLKEASENASAKARLLAKSLNVKLGKAFKVEESGSRKISQPPRPYMSMAKTRGGGGEAAQVEYGKEEINVSLQVEFKIK